MPNAMLNGFNHHWEEAGSGEAFVMLHGAAGSGAGFKAHLPELSKTLRVIIPDMRGMGGSAHVSSIPPSAWVDDLKALLDHLNIDAAHVYGTSLGARVALRFAIDYPARTRSLILDNPIVLNEAGGNAALNSRMSNPDNLPPEAAARYESQHGVDWKDVVRNYFAIRNEPALQEFYNLRELAKDVATPTLLTRGDSREDVTHPLPHVIELAYSLKNSRIWIKPSGGCFATPEGYDVVRHFVGQAVAVPAAR